MFSVLDLFSGIGGFSLGLSWAGGFETVAFCERDPFCQKILSKHWPMVPIYNDIRTLTHERLASDGIVGIDIITGGAPCQPASQAGKRRGRADDRWLWPEAIRTVHEFHPQWVIFENPYGFLTLDDGMEFEHVCTEMESLGYQIQTFIIPACAVGAPHLRYRAWIIANSHCERKSQQIKLSREERGRDNYKVKDASNHRCERIQGGWEKEICRQPAFSWCENIRGVEDYFGRSDIPQPLICRDDDGFSKRVDRLRALGNAVVPQIPMIIGQSILSAIKSHQSEVASVA